MRERKPPSGTRQHSHASEQPTLSSDFSIRIDQSSRCEMPVRPSRAGTHSPHSYYASRRAEFAANTEGKPITWPKHLKSELGLAESLRLRLRVLHRVIFYTRKSHEPPSWTQHRLERADRMLFRRRPFSARFTPIVARPGSRARGSASVRPQLRRSGSTRRARSGTSRPAQSGMPSTGCSNWGTTAKPVSLRDLVTGGRSLSDPRA